MGFHMEDCSRRSHPGGGESMAPAVVSRARALRALRRPGNTHAQVQETEAFLWFRAVSSCGPQALLYWPYDPGPVPSPLWAQVAAALPSSCRRGTRAPVNRVYTQGSSWDPRSPMGGLHAVGDPRGRPLLHTSDAPLSIDGSTKSSQGWDACLWGPFLGMNRSVPRMGYGCPPVGCPTQEG